jgi:hypothetical protein
MTFTIAALLVAWSAILILTMALAGVLRQLRTLAATGTLTPRVSVGPPLGAAAPPLPAAESLPKPLVLLFADRDCPGCAEVVPAFANGFAPGTSKLVIYSGEATEPVGVPVLADQEAAFKLWNIPVTPFCVVVDGRGRVAAAGPVGSRNMLDQLGNVIERRNLAA